MDFDKYITRKTYDLWNKVIEKYGQHSYRLSVDGIGRVHLTKGYTETIAMGNRNIQRVLTALLKKA